MKPFPLQLEIAGPIALWARPDTLPNPVSYVVPTFSGGDVGGVNGSGIALTPDFLALLNDAL